MAIEGSALTSKQALGCLFVLGSLLLFGFGQNRDPKTPGPQEHAQRVKPDVNNGPIWKGWPRGAWDKRRARHSIVLWMGHEGGGGGGRPVGLLGGI